MEVANLTVKLSSDVEQAISGLHKTDAAVTKSAVVAGKESEKIEGFMGKWKIGWIAMAGAAIASLYAVAKSSAVIGGYFSEFGMLLGYIFDEIGMAMAPILDPLLDWLWGLADAFAELPDSIKIAIGGLIAFAAAVPTVLVALGALKWALVSLGITAGLSTIAIIGATALVITSIIGFFVAYKYNLFGIRDRILKCVETIKTKLEQFSTFAAGLFEYMAKIIDISLTDAWLFDPEYTRKVLNEGATVFEEGFNNIRKIYNTFTGKITATITMRHKEWMNFWYDLKREARNIWDRIGELIWEPIQNAYNKIRRYVNQIIHEIRSIPVVSTITSYMGRYIPSFQHGGYVPTTGLAMLHAGEYVIPPGGTKNINNTRTIIISPTIYVSGEMRTDTDLRKLASDLSVYFKDEIKRQVRG